MFRKILGSPLCSRIPRALFQVDNVFQHNREVLLSTVLSKNRVTTCGSTLKFSSASPAEKCLDLQDSNRIENEITKETVEKINEQIAKGEEGRLFAVVHICGKQFKITAEDIIIIEGYWPPHPSDQILLEKVLLVGGIDFTLVGRPILPQGLVSVTATVIEKDLSHTKPLFYKKRRKQYVRLNFYRSQQTMLRINDISIVGKVNEYPDVQQYNRI